MVLGGRHLRQDLWIDSADKPFEALGYIGYDNLAGRYYSSWRDINFTGVIMAQGDYDAASRTYTFLGTLPGPAASEPGVVHPPSFPTCHVCQMYAPWSTSGGNVLFGDGSVKFVSTRVSLLTWAALSSMNLGDQPGDY